MPTSQRRKDIIAKFNNSLESPSNRFFDQPRFSALPNASSKATLLQNSVRVDSSPGDLYPPSMLKAFAYLRVSGKSQGNGDGFPRQLEAIRRYAKANDIRIIEVFHEKAAGGATG